MVIVGDAFVRKSAKNMYGRTKNSYGTTKFEVKIGAADKFSNNNPFITTRIINSFIKQLNDCQNMPKIIMLVLEDDLINNIKETKRDAATIIFEEYIEFIMREFNAAISHFSELLPSNAKRQGWPKKVILLPSMHRNYTQTSLQLRRALGEVMENKAKENEFMSLKLVQVWDQHHQNYVKSDNNQITNEGLLSFWEAVDRTIRFCDKKMIRAEAMVDNNPFKQDANPQNDGASYARNTYVWDRRHNQHRNPDQRDYPSQNRVWKRLDFDKQ